MTDTARLEERLAALVGTPPDLAHPGPTVDLVFLSPEDLGRLGTLAGS
jgi:hypothetical protein